MNTIIHLDKQLLIQAGFHLFNTALVIGLLGYLLYEPIRRFLSQRSERIATQIDDAEKTSKEVTKLKKDYEQRIDQINYERDEIISKARKIAHDKESQILKEARDEAKQLIIRSNIEIEQERLKAMDGIKTQIIEISTLLAGRYIETSIDANVQNKLLEEVIGDLGDVEWIN